MKDVGTVGQGFGGEAEVRPGIVVGDVVAELVPERLVDIEPGLVVISDVVNPARIVRPSRPIVIGAHIAHCRVHADVLLDDVEGAAGLVEDVAAAIAAKVPQDHVLATVAVEPDVIPQTVTIVERDDTVAGGHVLNVDRPGKQPGPAPAPQLPDELEECIVAREVGVRSLTIEGDSVAVDVAEIVISYHAPNGLVDPNHRVAVPVRHLAVADVLESVVEYHVALGPGHADTSLPLCEIAKREAFDPDVTPSRELKHRGGVNGRRRMPQDDLASPRLRLEDDIRSRPTGSSRGDRALDISASGDQHRIAGSDHRGSVTNRPKRGRRGPSGRVAAGGRNIVHRRRRPRGDENGEGGEEKSECST